MNKGEEIHPIKVIAWYQTNWAKSCFFIRKPYFRQILGHQRDKIGGRNTEMNRRQEIHPMLNVKYQMNWANSLLTKNQNPIFGEKNIYPPDVRN